MSRPDPSALDASPETACLTVYHDGACPLCEAEIALYRRIAPVRPVRFVDVSVISPDARIDGDLTGAEAMRRFHVRDFDGRLLSGARAFALLWRQYPGTRWLGKLLQVPVLLWLAELGYRGFLVAVRPLLQRLVRTWRGVHRAP